MLTYVRRECGQPATPVDTYTVKAVRALSIGRSRPWTDDELTKLAGMLKPFTLSSRARRASDSVGAIAFD